MRKIWKALEGSSIDLPDILEPGTAYFCNDISAIVIDHGAGPIGYGVDPSLYDDLRRIQEDVSNIQIHSQIRSDILLWGASNGTLVENAPPSWSTDVQVPPASNGLIGQWFVQKQVSFKKQQTTHIQFNVSLSGSATIWVEICHRTENPVQTVTIGKHMTNLEAGQHQIVCDVVHEIDQTTSEWLGLRIWAVNTLGVALDTTIQSPVQLAQRTGAVGWASSILVDANTSQTTWNFEQEKKIDRLQAQIISLQQRLTDELRGVVYGTLR